MVAGKNIVCVAGTRPEVIEMAPVCRALRAEAGTVDVRFVSTAQHRQMREQMLSIFGISPDHEPDLSRAGQTLTDMTCAVLQALDDYRVVTEPDLALAEGDTTTAMVTE